MEFNPNNWFSTRMVKTVPPHFVKCPTPLTNEALNWVQSRLVGRFSVSAYSELHTLLSQYQPPSVIYFEDPAEATMYELRWAGSK